MARTKLFKNNQSQAVRIPKALEWPDSVKDVEVIQDGQSRIISPVDLMWDSWFADSPGDTSYPLERDQPREQERPPL
ncbi:type II toxin-antitoxin system VapB family antitoxin [uncultured Arthrobacter sp.]|uniref:type II toxin-antitoxin system VapB family antitoxin n=1 Tax=uncultured Arthrobacter sp. TaxID=114050 RepID=UPI002632CBD2|nr:type II toxin-antitoxin system VapB family antitoxin [uncultured Arthrobacter sp.]